MTGPKKRRPRPKPRTTIGGVDTPDYATWGREVAARFGMDEPLPPSGGACFRVLFQPSFHPECMITVVEDAEGAEVSLATYGTNLWYWECHRLQTDSGKRSASDPSPAPPLRREESGRADADAAARFRAERPAAFPPPTSTFLGADGMRMSCAYRLDDGTTGRAETWQDHDPAAYRLAAAVLRLAMRTLRQPESTEVLAAIAEYLTED